MFLDCIFRYVFFILNHPNNQNGYWFNTTIYIHSWLMDDFLWFYLVTYKLSYLYHIVTYTQKSYVINYIWNLTTGISKDLRCKQWFRNFHNIRFLEWTMTDSLLKLPATSRLYYFRCRFNYIADAAQGLIWRLATGVSFTRLLKCSTNTEHKYRFNYILLKRGSEF